MKKNQYLVGFEHDTAPVYGQPERTPIQGEFVLRRGVIPLTLQQTKKLLRNFPGRTPKIYQLTEVPITKLTQRPEK